MTLMDWVQVAILLFLILLFLTSLFGRGQLRTRSFSLLRWLPTRALKSEGHWQCKVKKTDKHE